MKRKIFSVLLALVLVLSFSLVTAVPAGAQSTYYVATDGSDSDGNGTETWVDNDSNGIWSPGDTGPWQTISHAIILTVNTDTINVAAGTYAESLSVSKEISIIGAGPTTVVSPATDADGIVIAADNVLIKDLKVTAVSSGADPNIAISIQETDSVEINNVVVETTGDQAMGIWIGGSSNGLSPSSNLKIVKSQVTINNEATGIYAAHSDPVHSGWIIGGSASDANSVTANLGNPVELYDVSASEVSYNTLTTTASGGSNVIWSSELSDLSNLVFSNNVVTFGGPGSQVAIITDFPMQEAPVTDIATVTISGNTFSNWGVRALRVGDGSSEGGTVTGVTINSNIFNMTTTAEVIGGTDAPSATGTGNTFNVSSPATIQGAIDAALDGDTINVAAGTYAENVVINESVTLISDTGDYRTTGTILTGSGRIFTLGPVDNITIQGFRFENVTGSMPVIHGIGVGNNNIVIRSNSFTSNDGMAVSKNSVSGTGWLITDNNIDGVTGTNLSGLWLMGLSDSEISHNQISNTTYAGMILDSLQNVVVSGNTITNTPRKGIQVANSPDANVLITDNYITNTNTLHRADEGAISIYPNTTNIRIENNTLTGNYQGFTVRDKAEAVAADVHVNFNNIYGNDGFGVGNFAQGGGTLDATNNYWGHPSGPSHSPGSGDPVSGNVLYNPWLLEEVVPGEPLPTTFGKTLALNVDWTLVSTGSWIDPAETVGANVTIAYNYTPSLGYFEVDPAALVPVDALYLKTEDGGALGITYSGGVPVASSKALEAGWNLISSATLTNAKAVLSPLRFVQVGDEQGVGLTTVVSQGPFNLHTGSFYMATLTDEDWEELGGFDGEYDLNPFDGYWVYMNAGKVFGVVPK